jgi:hypothetical protein
MKFHRITTLFLSLLLLFGCNGKPASTTDGTEQTQTVPPTQTETETLPKTTIPDNTETTVPGTTIPEITTSNTTIPQTTVATTAETTPAETVKPIDTGAILVIGDRAVEHYYGVESALKKYGKVIGNIKAALPDVRVFAVFCPTAIEFTAPEDYQKGNRSQKWAAETAYAALPDTVIPVDVWSALNAHKNEYLYFRTDHHWTQRGAYYAYTAFAATAGFTPYALSDYESGKIEGFVGTMYTFLGSHPARQALKENPDTVEYFLPMTTSKAQYFSSGALTGGVSIPIVSENGDKFSTSWKYGIFLSGDHPVIRIQNQTVKNGKKLLVTKESYGNALVPFLTDHYEEVYVVDPREFNASGKPSLNLTKKAKEWGITDIACVNYAFSATSSGFMNMLASLFPAN